jgi:hypothetical protein
LDSSAKGIRYDVLRTAKLIGAEVRIVKRPEFLTLPAETLYAPYKHCYFGDLHIKGDTLNGNDWCYQDIAGAIDAHDSGEWADMLFRSAETGESLPMDFDCEGRDGSFEPDDTMYAVYEPQDVQYLINRLRRCLTAETEVVEPRCQTCGRPIGDAYPECNNAFHAQAGNRTSAPKIEGK